ncbi:hypothetical protein [Armatimonas sp.]|uniref:hypothetical protein n=1 Tax=Armatimonas sp. TaxID=1872638 RepID=UPI0037517801
MNLKPEDLGKTRGGTLIRQRGGTTDPEAERRQTLQTSGVAAAIGVGVGVINNNALMGLIMGAIYGGSAVLLLPRMRKKQIHGTPVSGAELARLRPQRTPTVAIPTVLDTIFSTLLGQPLPQIPQKHTLEDAYFELLVEVQALSVSQVETEAELRDTVRTLSDAVAALPATAPIDEDEIRELVADAEGLLFRSKRETDQIIAESLHRQAEAAVRRARALQNASKLARRTRTLREEVYRQIGALRASLPSYSQASQSVATGRIQELADSVNRVAQDAASVVAAQEELVQTLSPEWRVRTTVEETTPQIQRLGR